MGQKSNYSDAHRIKDCVKSAVPEANKVKATRGRGTAWGWRYVTVYVDRPVGCNCAFYGRCGHCRPHQVDIHKRAELAVLNSGVEIYYYYDDMDNTSIPSLSLQVMEGN